MFINTFVYLSGVLLLSFSLCNAGHFQTVDEDEDEYSEDTRREFDELIDALTERLSKRGRLEDDGRKLLEDLEEQDSLVERGSSSICRDEVCVRKYLERFNRTACHHLNIDANAGWNYATNVTAHNAKLKTKAHLAYTEWSLKMKKEFKQLVKRKIRNLSYKEKRLIKLESITAESSNPQVVRQLSTVKNIMTSIYASGKIVYKGKTLPAGETGVVNVFTKSRDFKKLRDIWKLWRDATGKKIRSDYTKMVKLLNIGARENNFKDYGYYEWVTDFVDPKFNEKVMNLYAKIKPLYLELHAYVRYKLIKFYCTKEKNNHPCIAPDGPIPAHLLGNVWAQQWTNIIDIVRPYPETPSPNVSKELKKQSWTVHKMFKAAETFFHSIGLFKMTKKFWQRSMFTKPKGRVVECHGSAEDFYQYDDFRIKMCTTLTREHFTTIHHEMGHITYFMAYRNQPFTFREGANSGFHEAIGDTIALSAGTRKHLKTLKLLKSNVKSQESDINQLMEKALEKVAFLPFGLLIDTWRWRVFNGTITPNDYNKAWWELRYNLQGFIPPVPRSEKDFDPGAKYHVAANVAYIRYFESFIIQFHFYESMCIASGHKGPLFECDFYKSKAAGKLLKSMLTMGKSKPWPEAMKKMTGQTEILLDSLNRYFKPLKEWMRKYRESKGYKLGWK